DPLGEGGVEDEAYLRIPSTRKAMIVVPIVILGGLTVVFGLWFEPFFGFADKAALELLDAGEYIDAVLGGKS
ncbi:MAG: Na+/H+ antiporter subunit D, partial [Chlorobiales bacterium]|nr:Na+/H+ antiporter subunit D [Chlorobiales bacterium]